MTGRQELVHLLCEDIIQELTALITKAETAPTTEGKDNENKKSLPNSVLQQIIAEVMNMHKALDPQLYTPGYPRFLSDSWGGYDLVDKLVTLSYEYTRIRKGNKFREDRK